MSSEVTRLVLVVAIMGAITAGVFVLAETPMEDDSSGVSGATDSLNLSQAEDGSVCVVFFYSPTCPHCENVEEYFETAPDGTLIVEKHRASNSGELWRQYLKAYDVPKKRWGAVPTVFVGYEYAIGDGPAIDLIENEIESNATVGCPIIERGE